MTQSVEEIFGELGISQYLDAFIEQGFDNWDTILDITESDLDALGVKLGHRRKLQRKIASSRGLDPDAALHSPTGSRPSIEDARFDTARQQQGASGSRHVRRDNVPKRKYRRHPKPDENAPERPPSAYVLFSNKMRDEIKGRNLTFTEIAKLVGENWQALSPAEREPYDTAALKAKERYNAALSAYKETPEYAAYCRYLAAFKAKYGPHSPEPHDSSKRPRTDSSNLTSVHGSSTSATPGGGSNAGSSSDSQCGSEPPPSRRQRQRIGSSVSVSGSQSSVGPENATPALVPASPPEQPTAPPATHSTPAGARLPASFVDVMMTDQPPYDAYTHQKPTSVGGSSDATSAAMPPLKGSDSSYGSMSSSHSFPRTPVGETTTTTSPSTALPIHALLSTSSSTASSKERQQPPPAPPSQPGSGGIDSQQQSQPQCLPTLSPPMLASAGSPTPPSISSTSLGGFRGIPAPAGTDTSPSTLPYLSPPAHNCHLPRRHLSDPQQQGQQSAGLDGVSALLRAAAGEMGGQRDHA